MLIARYEDKHKMLTVLDSERNHHCGYISPFGLCAYYAPSSFLIRVFRNAAREDQVTAVRDRGIGAYWSVCFFAAENLG